MRRLVIAALSAAVVAACSAGDKVIGSYGGALTGLDDTRTCPDSACDSANFHSSTVTSYADGGIDQNAPENDSWPVDPCNYYPNPLLDDGGAATQGEWSVADTFGNDTVVGWNFEATYYADLDASTLTGHVQNKTCVPSPLRGQGSIPSDSCGWKYQCVPANP